jgi:hypothetical protein
VKKALFSTALPLICVATFAHAGGMSAPVMEPVMAPVVVEEDSGSSGGFVVPLLLLAVIAAVVASDNDGGSVLSDARLKTDIIPVGVTPGGLPLYHFRYLGGTTVFEGVMAQDVALNRPDAVEVDENGFMSVDYSALGLTMKVVR